MWASQGSVVLCEPGCHFSRESCPYVAGQQLCIILVAPMLHLAELLRFFFPLFLEKWDYRAALETPQLGLQSNKIKPEATTRVRTRHFTLIGFLVRFLENCGFTVGKGERS